MVTVKALFLKLEVLTGKRGIFQTVVDILTSSLLQSNMALRSTFPLPSFLTNRMNTEQKSAYQDYLSLRSCLPCGETPHFSSMPQPPHNGCSGFSKTFLGKHSPCIKYYSKGSLFTFTGKKAEQDHLADGAVDLR